MPQRSVSKPRRSERRLGEGHPALAGTHLDAYLGNLEGRPDDSPRVDRLLTRLDRVVDLRPPKNVVVLGCGPRPQLIKILVARGHRVLGVEPVPSFVTAANEYLVHATEVRAGTAEALPVESSSQDLILCESVLEHVDSPRAALDEMYRALRPGGIAYVATTNRLRINLRGKNGEFNVPFFNWFPRLVRESYVFRHLHQRPDLANYSLRPAVHWFTFAQLCELGRESGFGQFYSLVDLLSVRDPAVSRGSRRRLLLGPIQRNPWLRALALTQVGHSIVMLKRPDTA